MGRRTSGESQITESQITAKILSQLKRLGGFWYKTHGGPFQVRGLPDIIGCYQGAFYGLEVKVPGRENTLTASLSEPYARDHPASWGTLRASDIP